MGKSQNKLMEFDNFLFRTEILHFVVELGFVRVLLRTQVRYGFFRFVERLEKKMKILGFFVDKF